MSKKAVIRLGDPTDHGGKVMTALDNFKYQDIPVTGEGCLTLCPKCQGVFPIIEGSDKLKYAGIRIALEDMQTACGAKLIATQHGYTIDTPSPVNNENGKDKNWIELQFTPNHKYTIEDAKGSGFQTSGYLDDKGFAHVQLPNGIEEVNFWFDTDVEKRPWYFDMPLQAASGINEMVLESLNTTFDLGVWLEENTIPLGMIAWGDDASNGFLEYIFPWDDNYQEQWEKLKREGNLLKWQSLPKPDSTAGEITKGVSQFLAGFIPTMRAVRFIKVGTPIGQMIKAAGVGAVVDATAFSPQEARLADLIAQYPELRNPVTEYLKRSPTDTSADGRLKNALEGLMLGTVADAFMRSLKMLKFARIKLLIKNAAVRNRYVFHLVDNDWKMESVLKGIQPRFFSEGSRFGKGFYVAREIDTSVAELVHHQITPSHGIKYRFYSGKAKILDLTDPVIAKEWGYSGGKISEETIKIGAEAQAKGFNVIKFWSERNPGGANYVIFDKFQTLLEPVQSGTYSALR